MSEILVEIRFANGTVTYDSNWNVVVNGVLWPRELAVASEMIKLYVSRETNANDT